MWPKQINLSRPICYLTSIYLILFPPYAFPCSHLLHVMDDSMTLTAVTQVYVKNIKCLAPRFRTGWMVVSCVFHYKTSFSAAHTHFWFIISNLLYCPFD